MLQKYRAAWILLLIAGLWTVTALTSPDAAQHRAAQAADDAQAAVEPELVPVEPDMHEFMEYVFEPGYKRLRADMAQEPADKAGWKGIKGDALSLAEGGNLLIMRAPEEEGATWKKLSSEVRSHGKQLYVAAKARDYGAAKTAYTSMLKSCNACHDEFAGGEHQLQP